jgi:hypothetical protein
MIERDMRNLVRAFFEIPLELKLIGADLVITLVALLMLLGPVRLEPAITSGVLMTLAALVVASIVNVVLVRLALRPVNSLAHVAWLVSQGLLGARVPKFPGADQKMAELSATINHLLDELVVQRAVIARLAEERRSVALADDHPVPRLARVRVSRAKVQSLHSPDCVSAVTLSVSSGARL